MLALGIIFSVIGAITVRINNESWLCWLPVIIGFICLIIAWEINEREYQKSREELNRLFRR